MAEPDEECGLSKCEVGVLDLCEQHTVGARRHIVVEEPGGGFIVGFNPDVAPPPLPVGVKPPSDAGTNVINFHVRYNLLLKRMQYISTFAWILLCLSEFTILRISSVVMSAFVTFCLFAREGRVERWRRRCLCYIDEAAILSHCIANMLSIVYLTIYIKNVGVSVASEIALNAIQWCVYLGILLYIEVGIVENSSSAVHPSIV